MPGENGEMVLPSFPDLLGDEEVLKQKAKQDERMEISSDEDDILLDELLTGDEDKYPVKPATSVPSRATSASTTSDHKQEQDGIETQPCIITVRGHTAVSSSNQKANDSDESSLTSSMAPGDEDSDDDSSQETGSLLEKAQERVAMQHLYEEIATLEESLAQKNLEIEVLSGQLRSAVSTKCDLVIAHTEMERHHESDLARKEQHVDALHKYTVQLQESQSEVERELLDELVKLTDELRVTKVGHQCELDDWERMHRNEMLEKDMEIAQLTQEIRTLLDDSTYQPPRSGRKRIPKLFKKKRGSK